MTQTHNSARERIDEEVLNCYDRQRLATASTGSCRVGSRGEGGKKGAALASSPERLRKFFLDVDSRTYIRRPTGPQAGGRHATQESTMMPDALITL